MANALYEAIVDGDLYAVHQIVYSSNINPDVTSSAHCQSALCVALEHGHDDIAVLLLETGADPYRGDSFSFSEHMKEPVHYAAAHACIKTLQWLLNYGVDIDSQDYTMITPLHYASSYGHQEVVRYLVKGGADVNHRSKSGRTAICKAAERSHADIVTYLHSVGAEINIQNSLNETLLFDCIEAPSMIQLLIDLGADMDLRDICGQHVLHIAAMIGPSETVEVLLGMGVSPNVQEELRNTPLHMAAIEGRCRVARTLINGGATINILNQTRISPMNLAMRHNHLELTEMLRLAGGWLTPGEISDLARHFRLSYNQLSDNVKSQIRQIRSLKNLSMLVIRRHLHKSIEEKVKLLSLPMALKRYITFENF